MDFQNKVIMTFEDIIQWTQEYICTVAWIFSLEHTGGCFLAFARQPYKHLKQFDAGHAVVSKCAVEHGLSKRCHLPNTPAEHVKQN